MFNEKLPNFASGHFIVYRLGPMDFPTLAYL